MFDWFHSTTTQLNPLERLVAEAGSTHPLAEAGSTESPAEPAAPVPGASPVMDVQQPAAATATATATARTTTPPTAAQYTGLLDEIEKLTGEVMTLRGKLWEAQDAVAERDDTIKGRDTLLEERDDKIRTLENHIIELLEHREKDGQTISMLKENNTSLVEEESKVRESLELMRKVFTRAQLNAKEDQERIAILKEERDDLLRQTKDLKENPLSASAPSKFDKAAIERVKQAFDEKEENLKSLLFQTEKKLESLKKKHEIAKVAIKKMTLQLVATKDSKEATKQLAKQRRVIDRLEQQITKLEIEEIEREKELRDDELATGIDVIHRGCFDEDLDHSLTKSMLTKLGCAEMRRC